MSRCFVPLLLLLLHFAYADDADDLIVQLPDGKVLGTLEQSSNGTEYYAFYQIPYAAPPINERRYQDTQDPEPWDGVLDATQHTKQCPQPFSISTKLGAVEETEDCLYLAVNTPVKPGTNGSLPVLLWIHGGGFNTGSISFYGPKYLMDHGIIVVIIQYRLGPFGFVSTGDGVIPGNLGLRDQRKAINWVHSNIQHFGGDPDQITIMGQSAGAITIGYLLLDLSLEGKFRGVIQQSASSGMRLGQLQNPREYAYLIAEKLDSTFSDSNSTEDLLAVLQTAPMQDILYTAQVVFNTIGATQISSTGVLGEIPWGVSTEDVAVEKDPVVTSPVLGSYKNGDFIKVPLFIGFNSEECLIFGLSNTNDYLTTEYDNNPSLMVDMRHPEISPHNRTAFGVELKALYTDKNFEQDYAAFVRYSTDSSFVMGVTGQANFASAHIPVYFYQFGYAGDVLGNFMYESAGLHRSTIPGAETVAHGEDLNYVWNSTYFPADSEPSESDLVTRNRLVKLIVNFVKYLNPTPEEDEELSNITWPLFTSDDLQYLSINNTLEIKSNPRNFKEKREVYEKYIGVNTVW